MFLAAELFTNKNCHRISMYNTGNSPEPVPRHLIPASSSRIILSVCECKRGLLRYNLHTVKFTLYTFPVRRVLTQSCNNTTIKTPNSSTTTQIPSCPFGVNPPSPIPCDHWSVCPWSFAFPECHINGVMQYVTFYVWVLPLGLMLLRSIHGFACISNLFLLIVT